MPGTAVSLLWLLMLYHRLTRDVDMAEEAELRVLEDGDVRGGASRRHSECALPTVIGVHVGCTTAQDAMRMGAVFVRPVQSDGMHRESTGRMAIGSGADVEEQGAAAADTCSSRPRKTKRMDRRLTHWQCTFCRHEMLISEEAEQCSSCNGAVKRKYGKRVGGAVDGGAGVRQKWVGARSGARAARARTRKCDSKKCSAE